MTHIKPATLLLLFTLFSIANHIQADTIPHKQINEITVYSLSSGQFNLPGAIVDRKTIESSAFVTPADAFRTQPGISVVRDGVWTTTLNVRGMSEQRLLFLHDGDRMLSATDISGVLSTVNMESLERIEVIKGAGSVMYGTGAMGGVVSFIPQRPEYGSGISGKASSGWQTANSLWANAANLNFSVTNWYIALNGSYRTAQNMQTPEGKILNSQFNDASWGINGGMKYGDNQELLVNYNHFEAWNVGIPGSSSFPATATARYSAIKRNQLSGEYIFSDLSYMLRELRFKAYTQNIIRDVELKPNASNVTLPASMNVTSGAKATAALYFNDYNTMTVGAETWLRDAETFRTKINIQNDSTFIYTGEVPTPKAKMFDAGIFAFYKKVIDPHYLKLNAGIRLDFIRTQNDSAFNRIFQYRRVNGERTDIPFQKNMTIAPNVKNEISYAAHADIEYLPAKRHKFTLSLANAYRVASIEERFKYIDLGGAVHAGDIDLKPEKGLFANLNYSITKNKLLLKTDLFYNYLFDMIAEEKVSDSPLLYKNKNIDKAMFTGAELSMEWLISKQFKASAQAGYVYTRDVETGKPLPLIPPAHGLVSLTYFHPKYVDTTISMEWAAAQNEIADNETATPGYAILNIDFQSMPIKVQNSYVQLFAGVNNILDKAYRNHLFNNRPGMDKLYEAGRNVFVKLKWGW